MNNYSESILDDLGFIAESSSNSLIKEIRIQCAKTAGKILEAEEKLKSKPIPDGVDLQLIRSKNLEYIENIDELANNFTERTKEIIQKIYNNNSH